MKVYDLATELKVSNKDLLQFLRESRIRIKDSNAKLDSSTAAKIKKTFLEKKKRDMEQDAPLETKELEIENRVYEVSELEPIFGISLAKIMKVFLQKGMLLNLNSDIKIELLIDVAKELGVSITLEDTTADEQIGLKTKMLEIDDDHQNMDPKELLPRPPIVTILGHVDHGKTLLLDTIRKTNVVAKEAGGITQHIGAYQVTAKDGKKVTFLDTPGHEAFTSLRARGAQITDIAILVVAADEGIKPQTEEAIHHVQAADVPIIVALNKIDKPEADIEKCKQQLSNFNLVAEDWGGDTVFVGVSAKTGKGVDELLEMITLVSDMLELKAPVTGKAKGVVIEAMLSKQKGPLATVLIKTGTLNIGDYFVVGSNFGKVRALIDDNLKRVPHALPATPIEILGCSEVPSPGAIFEVMNSEKEVRMAAEKHLLENKESKDTLNAVSFETLSHDVEEGHLSQLNIILKSDVHGSLEALKASIDKIDAGDISIRLLHDATGIINENDVMLANASKAIILGFGVSTSPAAKKLAEESKIEIKTYKIIYELIEDIEKVLKGMYKPVFEEVEFGVLEIRKIFKFSKVGSIAGCYVKEGIIKRNSIVRIYHENDELYSGEINTLKRFKEDVKEVKEGFECGVVFEKFSGFQEGDTIKTFELREVRK